MMCREGYVNGFKVEVQEHMGTADDAGIINLSLHCQNGQVLTPDLYYGPDIAKKAKWIHHFKNTCDKDQVICGLKTKVEDDHHGTS